VGGIRRGGMVSGKKNSFLGGEKGKSRGGDEGGPSQELTEGEGPRDSVDRWGRKKGQKKIRE